MSLNFTITFSGFAIKERSKMEERKKQQGQYIVSSIFFSLGIILLFNKISMYVGITFLLAYIRILTSAINCSTCRLINYWRL